MSKRREALRRGVRTFIEDTSRELADLEGRPLRPYPDSEADAETTVVSDAVDAAERVATESVPPDSAPPDEAAAPTPTPNVETAALRHKVPDSRESPPEPPAAQARAIPGADTAPVTTPKASHAPAPAVLEREAEGPSIGPPPVPQRFPDVPPPVPAAPAYIERPKRRVKAPVRRRPRQTQEVIANGVSPAQVHARKGVCFAYFLNHECWRVPDAYCNSALQVCITRECPIYHLHRDALERRFAQKFKHFW